MFAKLVLSHLQIQVRPGDLQIGPTPVTDQVGKVRMETTLVAALALPNLLEQKGGRVDV